MCPNIKNAGQRPWASLHCCQWTPVAHLSPPRSPARDAERHLILKAPSTKQSIRVPTECERAHVIKIIFINWTADLCGETHHVEEKKVNAISKDASHCILFYYLKSPEISLNFHKFHPCTERKPGPAACPLSLLAQEVSLPWPTQLSEDLGFSGACKMLGIFLSVFLFGFVLQ